MKPLMIEMICIVNLNSKRQSNKSENCVLPSRIFRVGRQTGRTFCEKTIGVGNRINEMSFAGNLKPEIEMIPFW